MRIVLLLLVALAGISCSKPEPANLDVAKQQVKLGEHGPKQYSLLNEQMVYNHRIAIVQKNSESKTAYLKLVTAL